MTGRLSRKTTGAGPACRPGRDWRVLLVWMIVLAAVWLATVLVRQGGTADSGDPLLDRYLVEISRNIGSDPVFNPYQTFSCGAFIPDAVMAQWEDEFGADPRYWQMRYYFARESSPSGGQARGDDVPQPVDFLWEAVDRDIADGCILIHLCRQTRNNLRDRLKAELPEIPTRAYLTDEIMQQSAELTAKTDAELLRVLDLAVETGPQYAWLWYERAFYWLDRGEIDLAVADLQAGNAAPDISDPRLFPLSTMLEKVDSGALSTNDAATIDILNKWICEPFPNYIVVKERLKDLVVAAQLNGDTEPLAEWHRFSCRMGMSRNDQLVQTLVGIVMVNTVRDHFATSGIELTVEQQQTLRAVAGAHNRLRTGVRTSNTSPFSTGVLTWQSGIDLLTTGNSQQVFASRQSELQFHQSTAVPVLTDLLAVDYTTLELPDCMQQYLPQLSLGQAGGGPGGGGVNIITPEFEVLEEQEQ